MKESVKNLFRNVIVSGKKFVAGANLIALTIAGSGCATAQHKNCEEIVEKTENGYKVIQVCRGKTPKDAMVEDAMEDAILEHDPNVQEHKINVHYSTGCHDDMEFCYYSYNNWGSPKPSYKTCNKVLEEPTSGTKCNTVVYFYDHDKELISFACSGNDSVNEERTITGTIESKKRMFGESEYQNALEDIDVCSAVKNQFIQTKQMFIERYNSR